MKLGVIKRVRCRSTRCPRGDFVSAPFSLGDTMDEKHHRHYLPNSISDGIHRKHRPAAPQRPPKNIHRRQNPSPDAPPPAPTPPPPSPTPIFFSFLLPCSTSLYSSRFSACEYPPSIGLDLLDDDGCPNPGSSKVTVPAMLPFDAVVVRRMSVGSEMPRPRVLGVGRRDGLCISSIVPGVLGNRDGLGLVGFSLVIDLYDRVRLPVLEVTELAYL